MSDKTRYNIPLEHNMHHNSCGEKRVDVVRRDPRLATAHWTGQLCRCGHATHSAPLSPQPYAHRSSMHSCNSSIQTGPHREWTHWSSIKGSMSNTAQRMCVYKINGHALCFTRLRCIPQTPPAPLSTSLRIQSSDSRHVLRQPALRLRIRIRTHLETQRRQRHPVPLQ